MSVQYSFRRTRAGGMAPCDGAGSPFPALGGVLGWCPSLLSLRTEACPCGVQEHTGDGDAARMALLGLRPDLSSH